VEEVKRLLIEAAKEAKGQYLAIGERKGILSENIPLMEDLGRRMFEAQTSTVMDSESRSAVPLENRKAVSDPVSSFMPCSFVILISSSQYYLEEGGGLTESHLINFVTLQLRGGEQNTFSFTDDIYSPPQFLLSDGIQETYIQRSYNSPTGEEIFAVDSLRFVANAEGPNL